MRMLSGRNRANPSKNAYFKDLNLNRFQIVDLMKLTGLYLIPILEKLKDSDDPLFKLAEQKLKKSKDWEGGQ